MYPPVCPEPVARPVMLQTWSALTYLHWPYEPAAVQRILPDGLVPDTHDGTAWVGLIPFHMEHIRTPGLPRGIPWIGTFPETNVRTYVVGPDGVPGVWFCSLDITRLGAVLVSWATYRIPYMWSKMTYAPVGDFRSYRSRRRWPGPRRAGSEVVVEVGAEIPPTEQSELDHFLTARWGLWSQTKRGPRYAPVDHPTWPLHHAHLHHLRQDLIEAAGLPAPSGEPHLLYSPGVDVRIGVPRKART
jgi:uncharacterized protein YqjF (DUF2071 family)